MSGIAVVGLVAEPVTRLDGNSKPAITKGDLTLLERLESPSDVPSLKGGPSEGVGLSSGSLGSVDEPCGSCLGPTVTS